MDYLLIRGTFHVVGFSPDGDSLRFSAANPALWERLVPAEGDTPPGKVAASKATFDADRTKNHGAAQLRLQGIDAAETHFRPMAAPSGSTATSAETSAAAASAAPKVAAKKASVEFSQPGDLATAAAEALLGMLGVTGAVWKPTFGGRSVRSATVAGQGVVTTPLADAVPGFVVTRELEAKGRPVAWVFAGDAPLADGASVGVDALADLVPRSVNHQLVARGLVYPFFFMTLQGKLRALLAAAATAAQGVSAGSAVAGGVPSVWRTDRTMRGLPLTDIGAILPGHEGTPDGALVYPYLFRKVLKHWFSTTPSTDAHAVDITGLCRGANPPIYLSGVSDFVRLSDVLDLSNHTLRLTTPVQEIVFLE